MYCRLKFCIFWRRTISNLLDKLCSFSQIIIIMIFVLARLLFRACRDLANAGQSWSHDFNLFCFLYVTILFQVSTVLLSLIYLSFRCMHSLIAKSITIEVDNVIRKFGLYLLLTEIEDYITTRGLFSYFWYISDIKFLGNARISFTSFINTPGFAMTRTFFSRCT